MAIPRVAIACQGGGSHAAFSAGVLARLLGAGQRERFELVALSGTSGGAMCASLVWRGLVSSGPEEAVQRRRPGRLHRREPHRRRRDRLGRGAAALPRGEGG